VQGQADKAHEAQPVAQLIFGLIVRQRVERLQHQDAQHQRRVVGWVTAAAAVRALQRHLQIRPEQLQVHHRRQPLQRITGRRQRPQMRIGIKQSRLTQHRCLHLKTDPENQFATRAARVFRGVHLSRFPGPPHRNGPA